MQLTSQQFYLKRARGAFYSAGILLRCRPSPSLDNEQKSKETHDRMLTTTINYYLILFITVTNHYCYCLSSKYRDYKNDSTLYTYIHNIIEIEKFKYQGYIFNNLANTAGRVFEQVTGQCIAQRPCQITLGDISIKPERFQSHQGKSSLPFPQQTQKMETHQHQHRLKTG